ncbi:MAG: NusG domain II-containing protein [Sterolibacteriaceae bacterium MAG5]|nr:NusG domain II-containing protein [Candidatus Nitricoxidireducens bremensis]
MKPWLSLLRPGDWLVAGAALAAVAVSFPLLWRGGPAEKAVVKRDGAVVAELPLNISKRIEVQGALGTSVIEVQPGRARVAADPGPRQYCVKQGWLTQANAVAICAPNHVTLALVGATGGYDSLNY